MQLTSRPSRRAPGFSLIELLLVLFLMIALSVMMYGFGSERRQRTQKQLCQDNLQKIYVALQVYAKDNGGSLPMVTNALTSEAPLDLLVPKYSADTAIFTCPGGRDQGLDAGQSLQGGKISYAYYMGRRLDDPGADRSVIVSDRQVDTTAKLKNQPVFSATGQSPGNNHHKYGGNFLMGDGSVLTSGPLSALDLPLPSGVTLLNPKP